MLDFSNIELRFCLRIFEAADTLRDMAFTDWMQEGSDATLRQCMVIKTVKTLTQEDHPEGVTLKELAGALSLTAGTVSELVQTLVKRNVLQREVHPTDRRKVLIKLTPTCSDRMERGLENVAKIALKVLAGIKPADQKKLLNLLETIHNQLNQMKEK